MKDTKKPNVLLIMTDQQRYDCIGYANDNGLMTPVLDNLSYEGARFNSAYTTCPLCVPARAGLLSGKYSHKLGILNNERSLPEGHWTVARSLKGAGYQTALIGKMHLKPIHAKHGFDIMETAEHDPTQQGCFKIDEYHKWLESVGVNDIQEKCQFPSKFKSADCDYKEYLTAQPFPYDKKYHSTEWTKKRAIEYLKTKDKTDPYFLCLSFLRPHTPVNPPKEFIDMYKSTEIQIPDYKGLGIWPDKVKKILGEKFVNYYDVKINREVLKRFIRYTYASLTHIDSVIGQILKHVSLKDTVVIFTSDHGDYLGNKHRMLKSPAVLFDDLVKIPLFISGDNIPKNKTVNQNVSIIDIPGTITDICGDNLSPIENDGKSLTGYFNGYDKNNTRPVFSASELTEDRFSKGTGGYMTMVKKGDYKLIVSDDFKMLFNTKEDPKEQKDLLVTKEYNQRIYNDLLQIHNREFDKI